MAHAASLGSDAVVTNGGVQSNHARVVALQAAQRGWECTLVLHGDSKTLREPRGNLLLMLLAGAKIQVVAPECIANEIGVAISGYEARGLRPYLIPGGGHCVEGALAYVDAAKEMAEQCAIDDWQPDWIVHASGTGATQAGLLAGLDEVGSCSQVIGVSVARRNPEGGETVQAAYAEVSRRLGNTPTPARVRFLDAWVGEGYEKAGEHVLSSIRLAARMEGLILDPTYSGKAFHALLDMVEAGEIGPRSRVLFWHTGGLLNLLASNYLQAILRA